MTQSTHLLKPPSYADLRRYRLARGYPWFTDPYDINLFVMRDEEVGNWGDWVCLAYVDNAAREIVEAWQSSADAADDEWVDPTHPGGCIAIVDQHVPGGYGPGMHGSGRYRRPALRQLQPFEYVRWPPTKGYRPSVSELEAITDRFAAIRWTNLHNRVSDRMPSRPASGDTEGCPLTRERGAITRILELCGHQLRHVGVDTLSPTFGRLRDLG